MASKGKKTTKYSRLESDESKIFTDARDSAKGMGHISGRKSETQKLRKPYLLDSVVNTQPQATPQRLLTWSALGSILQSLVSPCWTRLESGKKVCPSNKVKYRSGERMS